MMQVGRRQERPNRANWLTRGRGRVKLLPVSVLCALMSVDVLGRVVLSEATRSIRLGNKPAAAVERRKTPAATQPRAADRVARPWLCSPGAP
jgi:hypothetical protein